MRRLYLAAVAVLGLSAVVATAEEPTRRPGVDQPTSPTMPPVSGRPSSDLNRTGGIITPPTGVDREIKQTPPPTGAKMPVIPPPGRRPVGKTQIAQSSRRKGSNASVETELRVTDAWVLDRPKRDPAINASEFPFGGRRYGFSRGGAYRPPCIRRRIQLWWRQGPRAPVTPACREFL
jgi:hypothetical protein